MDDKMKTSPYLTAGIITVLIFLSGVMFGIFIDNFRLSEIRSRLSKIEVDSSDAILLALYFQRFGKESCNISLDTNLKFNEKIYSEGKGIEDAISVNRFTPELEQEWKRYVLLQAQFWFNSIELKKNCDFNYSNVVHIFKLSNLSHQEKAINSLQSQIMLSLKEKCGNEIMLIPLTADSGLSIIDAILFQYNITKLPTIIVDEKYVFQGLTTMEELNKYIKC